MEMDGLVLSHSRDGSSGGSVGPETQRPGVDVTSRRWCHYLTVCSSINSSTGHHGVEIAPEFLSMLVRNGFHQFRIRGRVTEGEMVRRTSGPAHPSHSAPFKRDAEPGEEVKMVVQHLFPL